MNTKKYFAVSGALLRENFKLHWYFPVLYFLLYFLSCPLIAIMSDYTKADFIRDSLNNLNVGFIAIELIAPVVTACVFMRYYHSQNKAFYFHAQPYSRSRLFNTEIITGLIMMIIPVILTAIIFMLMRNGITVFVDADGSEYPDAPTFVNTIETFVYDYSDVFKWALESAVILVFYYGLFVLAGSLVGNNSTMVLACGVFFVIVPTIVGIIELYSEQFLAGYVSPPNWANDLVVYSNPLFGVVEEGMILSAKTEVIYLLLSIVFMILAKFACSKANLERVEDSMMFDSVDGVVTVVLTFCFSAGVGIVLINPFGLVALYTGIFVGAIAAFLIVRVIIQRSVKIFSKRNCRLLIISLIILILFSLFFIFDIAGYEKKTKDAKDVAAVNLSGIVYLDDFIRFSGSELLEDSEMCSDEIVIQKVAELNEYIVENERYCSFDSNNSFVNEEIHYISINYLLKNGRNWERKYRVLMDDTIRNMMEEIINDDYAIERRTIGNKLDGKAKYAEIYYEVYDNSGSANQNSVVINIADEDEIKALIDAHDKDIQHLNYWGECEGADTDEEKANYTVWGSVSLFEGAKEKGDNEYIAWYSFDVKYKNTMELVKSMENALYD